MFDDKFTKVRSVVYDSHQYIAILFVESKSSLNILCTKFVCECDNVLKCYFPPQIGKKSHSFI